MNKIHTAFNLLKETGKFEPSQLHEGNDRIWITPYGKIIDFQQIHIALGAAELFHLLPTFMAPARLELLYY